MTTSAVSSVFGAEEALHLNQARHFALAEWFCFVDPRLAL